MSAETPAQRKRFPRLPRPGRRQRPATVSQDDSVIDSRPEITPSDGRRFSRDDSDLALRSERAPQRGASSRLVRFRKKLRQITLSRRGVGVESPGITPTPSDAGDTNTGTEGDTRPRNVSFGRNESFESDISVPRSVRAEEIIPSPVRSKPQLMFDPTSMPYNPAMHQQQLKVETKMEIEHSNYDSMQSISYSDSDADYQFTEEDFANIVSQPVPANGTPHGQRARYSVYQGNRTVKRKFRVRPYHRFPDGRQMTEEAIYADSLKPSKTFKPIKSYLAPTSNSTQQISVPEVIQQLYGSPGIDGRIGALRVEVLGCVALARTNKPDIGVYCVCGDAAFCTDVISGYRSPMWPCETQRAALFPIHHAYAQLFVGVFDFKVQRNKDNDVFCGRVALDIASLRPDTEYDVTLPLRVSTFVYDTRKRGVIRLRFSMHWFNERAAVVSYFKSAKSLAKSSPFVEGHPTIPCADPKTFRNVAVTVYGQDLPGKYSRTAFRATMREFNLYQQNLRLALQYLALDAILYERPHISLYLFGAGMYCVATSSIRMVPPFFVGYILIQLWENYRSYVGCSRYNLGYMPVTLQEIVEAIVDKPGSPEPSMHPLAVQKKNKRRTRAQASRSDDDSSETSDDEIPVLDHWEFPFSERDTYPKMSVERALAPGVSNRQGGFACGVFVLCICPLVLVYNGYLTYFVWLHGRLSRELFPTSRAPFSVLFGCARTSCGGRFKR